MRAIFRCSSPLFVLVAVACGGDAETPLAPDPEATTMLDIVTDAPAYAAGGEGLVLARSKTEAEIRVDLCPWELDRWTGRDCELELARPDAQSCLPILRVLQLKQAAAMPFKLPVDLPAGEYRFRFERIFDAEGAQLPATERVSRVIRIEP